MSKILITGNGFDLLHHLPTKYHHFILIMQTIEKNQYTTDVSFNELFGGVFKEKHQFEFNSIEENYNTSNILFGHEKLNRIKQLLETNLWYKYFKTVLEIETWIDFEIEVESFLSQLEFFNRFKNKWKIKDNIFDEELIRFTDFELFNLIKVINSDGGFKLNDCYIDKRKISIDLKKMVEDLARNFEDFIVIFNRYLVDVVTLFYNNIKEKPVIPFHLIDEIYTFNYTPTLEKIYNIDKSKMTYLHGEINEDCQKQNLVLGINEISDEIKQSKVFDFTKYYQKIKKNSNKKFIDIPSENQGYSEETFFYIIGHSLDKSDKEYVLDLFRFLEQEPLNKSKICIFYYDDKDRDSKIRNLLSVVEEKIITRMNKENRLYFVELNTTNLGLEFNEIAYKHDYIFI